jgi:protein PhnA
VAWKILTLTAKTMCVPIVVTNGLVAAASADDNDERIVKDSNGNVLSDGDAVVVIKDLKVKGSSTTLKMGTKIKSIRIVGGDHEVDCKTDSGSYMLKACYLKKV